MTTTPFFAAIEASRGTAVFGSVPALSGEITRVAEDHAVLETDDGDTVVITAGAMLYWRFRDESGAHSGHWSHSPSYRRAQR